jgi:site-specific DNA-methyltransferase (adenine-specific)
MISKESIPTKTVDADCNYIGFETEEEAKNFISYIKTNFARFCLSLLKFDANVQKSKLAYIPIIDFSVNRTNDELMKMFGISNEMKEIINKTIAPFY